MRRPTIAGAIVLLLVAASSMPSTLALAIPLRYVALVSKEPLLERLERDPARSEIALLQQMVAESEALVGKLRRAGLVFAEHARLYRLLHAVVLEVPVGHAGWLAHVTRLPVEADQVLHPLLERSVRWIGGTELAQLGPRLGANVTGRGVIVAVIDTGVDYTHPDLGGGIGAEFKVIGGFDFVRRQREPLDRDGHGTHVAGIIAANGRLRGVAPDARLLAYRVVNLDGNVFASDIAAALEQALEKGARVANLSLGTPVESGTLDEALRNAARAGLLVVVAGGNSGPDPETIAEPGGRFGALTVGASFNNRSSSLGATFITDTGFAPYVLPMNGSVVADHGVTGRIVDAGFGRFEDIKDLDLRGAIAVVERGPNPPIGNPIFFSLKESNVADRGAVGLIVYNNASGFQRGFTSVTIVHKENPPGYKPRIPVVAMAREDGLALKTAANGQVLQGALRVRVEPDLVAPFSSRGPGSPFFVKPDLVAPGNEINSTSLQGKYSPLTGTSFAAPHAAGAAALLLQLYPTLSAAEVRSILTTATKLLLRPNGQSAPASEQGGGRLDLVRAVQAPLVATPHQLVFHVAAQQPVDGRTISLRPLGDAAYRVRLKVDWRFATSLPLHLDTPELLLRPHQTAQVRITVERKEATPGRHEGSLFMEVNGSRPALRLPVLVYANNASVVITMVNGSRFAQVTAKVPIRAATIILSGPALDRSRFSLTDPNQPLRLPALGRGVYWVDAELHGAEGRRMLHARAIFEVRESDAAPEPIVAAPTGVPLRVIYIATGFVLAVTVAVALHVVFRRRPVSRSSEVSARPAGLGPA